MWAGHSCPTILIVSELAQNEGAPSLVAFFATRVGILNLPTPYKIHRQRSRTVRPWDTTRPVIPSAAIEFPPGKSIAESRDLEFEAYPWHRPCGSGHSCPTILIFSELPPKSVPNLVALHSPQSCKARTGGASSGLAVKYFCQWSSGEERRVEIECPSTPRKRELTGTVPIVVRAHPSPQAGERACPDLAEALSVVEGAVEGGGANHSSG